MITMKYNKQLTNTQNIQTGQKQMFSAQIIEQLLGFKTKLFDVGAEYISKKNCTINHLPEMLHKQKYPTTIKLES